ARWLVPSPLDISGAAALGSAGPASSTIPGVTCMHARVAKFEDADPQQLEETLGQIRERASSGPPEGVPATGFLLLADRENGAVLAISLYETEADLEQGDQTLNAMDPPVPGGMGRRASVERYEVAVQVQA
ncbi:MAG: hypothetical protein M3296_05055, partial [Actinomycetota bacterium]|nr:hypothetical protein [Actinomycetota bacterium]